MKKKNGHSNFFLGATLLCGFPHTDTGLVHLICFGQRGNSEHDTSKDLSMPGPPSPVALATLAIIAVTQAVILDAERAKKEETDAPTCQLTKACESAQRNSAELA